MKEPDKLINLNIEMLTSNKNQPRRVFNDESLEELANSIKKYGIINPIIVRQVGEKYEIIAGERRFRAAKLAGLTEIPAIVKSIDELELLEISLIENLQRENISAIEEAKSYETIMNVAQLPQEDLSQLISKSPTYIQNKIKLINLPKNIQQALALRKISEKHAKMLLNVDEEEKQTELLNRIINEKLTVKELDTIINEKMITEEEIKNAISDIMKSLNIDTEEKEEEKESDNMNNGNFFPNPNMNQNIQSDAQPMTLNAMNNQSFTPQMPQMNAEMAPMQETPMPQVEQNPIPNFNIPMPQSELSTPPVTDNPNFNNEQFAPATSNLELPKGEPIVPNMQPEIQSMPQIEQNPIPNFSAPITPESASTLMTDVPLFNSEANMIPQQDNQVQLDPTFEVPVATTPIVETPSNSQKLIQIQELLNNNGIEYKSYSNETGHCIIIEL